MKIFIIYATAGHGHKKAAEYLKEEFDKRKENHPDLQVQAVNFLDYTPPHFRKLYPWTYEFMVSKATIFWQLSFYLTNHRILYKFIVAPLRRLFNKIHTIPLEKFLIKENPDVLICTHFCPPEVATSLKRRGKINSEIVTVVTDFLPHTTWINQGTDYFVTMTDEGEEVLRSWNFEDHRIKIFGIPVSLKFEFQGKEKEMREKLGLEAAKFTVLLTNGSFGIGPIEELIDILSRYHDRLQLIIVCGNNKKLFDDLQKKKDSIPGKIFGFVDNMDELMEASDIVIAKTGGLTTSESLAKMVPMVISKPIPGQESGNADYLTKNNCAYRIDRPEEIENILQKIFESGSPLKIVDNAASIEAKRKNIMKVRRPHATRDIVDFVLTLK